MYPIYTKLVYTRLVLLILVLRRYCLSLDHITVAHDFMLSIRTFNNWGIILYLEMCLSIFYTDNWKGDSQLFSVQSSQIAYKLLCHHTSRLFIIFSNYLLFNCQIGWLSTVQLSFQQLFSSQSSLYKVWMSYSVGNTWWVCNFFAIIQTLAVYSGH